MFTGLIGEIGQVVAIDKSAETLRITICASRLVRELKTGDSIAVNGVCLTALDITADSFTADLAAETIHRTSLARLAPASSVNLELPTKSGACLGGHVVQGHVDGVGKVHSLVKVAGGNDWRLVVELPADLEKYVVFKGSIAIEGISLTVARIDAGKVTVAVIPHTYDSTNLKSLKTGDPVNIEVDVIAKYSEKMLQGEGARAMTAERILSEGF